MSTSCSQLPSEFPESSGESSVINRIVQANERYANGFADPGVGHRPALKTAVVTCMDARIDVAALLGLRVGDCHVLRNAGGAVTDDTIRSLAVSQRVLGTRSIMIIHHTCCGMQTITEGFRQELEAEVGIRPSWAVESFTDLDQDVRQSMARVRASAFLPHTNDVRGFVFDLQTGRLREIVA